MKITLESCPSGIIIQGPEPDMQVLVQSDWDYPGVASTFGWSGICLCGETDGTVDCPHATAADMITGAVRWLHYHATDGLTVDDPGYFAEF